MPSEYNTRMRRICCIAALAACTPADRAYPGDADAGATSTDALPFAEYRPTTAVIVGSNRIVWSRGGVNCPDLGCPEDLVGSTVLTSEFSSSAIKIWVKSEEGLQIVGDENEVFWVAAAGESGWVLTRLRLSEGAYPEAISIPRWDLTALAADATHVYWFERPNNGSSAIRRASRAGDGSDAETIATDMLRPYRLVVFGGYVFFSQETVVSQQLHSVMFRVPVTGGTPERVTNEMDWSILAAGENVMYVSYPLSPMQPPYPVRIVTMTADGAILQTLVDNLPQYDSPAVHTVLDRGELFWTGTYQNGILFRMPVTGGTPTAIGSVGYMPFGVTADSIVYGFTTTGYETLPR
jgi:hypothetical protein